MGNSFASLVAQALATNLMLVHLDLSSNHFPRDVLLALAAGLKRNHTLLGLHMDDQPMARVDSWGFIKLHKQRDHHFQQYRSHKVEHSAGVVSLTLSSAAAAATAAAGAEAGAAAAEVLPAPGPAVRSPAAAGKKAGEKNGKGGKAAAATAVPSPTVAAAATTTGGDGSGGRGVGSDENGGERRVSGLASDGLQPVLLAKRVGMRWGRASAPVLQVCCFWWSRRWWW